MLRKQCRVYGMTDNSVRDELAGHNKVSILLKNKRPSDV